MSKKTEAMVWTDRKLKSLEKKITQAYEKASEEVTQKMQTYLDRFAKEDAMWANKLKQGLVTKKQYIEWRTNHFMIGKNWEHLKDTLAHDLANTDKIVAGIINGNLKDIYMYNANYAYYELERDLGTALSFDLYDHKAVENLLKDKPNFIPKVNPKIPKDERWNRQKIQSEMLQGILQGESIPKIAKRMQAVTNMDRASSIRNARTYTTSVENKAKMDRYSEAEEMGIELEKEWMATLDDRTRESHRELDGERVGVDEEFSNGLMYPGDASGEPEEIYNCRCRIVSRIKNHNYDRSGRNSKLENMSYEEWKQGKTAL